MEPVGATVTLLVERLQASGLTLAPEEATLLLLGIYEDTGSLTYDTTTGRDAATGAGSPPRETNAIIPRIGQTRRAIITLPLVAAHYSTLS